MKVVGTPGTPGTPSKKIKKLFRKLCKSNEKEEETAVTNVTNVTFDEKCLAHIPCAYPDENEIDEVCGETPTNEYDGQYYCRKHFDLIQKEELID